MKKTMTALIALAIIASVWQPANAADKIDNRALGKAWRTAEQALKDGAWPIDDDDGTVDRLSKVEGLLDYKTALEMLAYFEDCDTAWSGGKENRLGKKVKTKGDRPDESYRVATAILDTVRTIKYPGEAMKFAEEGDLENTKDWPLRVRMAMMDAITNNAEDSEDVLKWVVNYAQNREGDGDIRILAVQCLDDVGDEEGVFEALMACLMDPSWRIREVAVEAMVGVADNDEDRVVVVLIDRLSQEQGRLRKTIADALRSITGADNGTNSDDWVEWFKNKKREEAGLPAKTGKHRGSEVIFKTVSFSNRYVFVLDTSISMTKAMKPAEKEKIQESMKQEEGDKREPLPWKSINSLADVAREELIRSLKAMDA
ncbi:HEAT repeat domain-containing protein, partial [Planctomycetota bacterium]|nr:HEAT repeat domain-containing protein [Planctomycetota bacterium]